MCYGYSVTYNPSAAYGVSSLYTRDPIRNDFVFCIDVAFIIFVTQTGEKVNRPYNSLIPYSLFLFTSKIAVLRLFLCCSFHFFMI